MKKQFVMLCMIAVLVWISVLPGCSRKNPTTHYNDPKSVEQVGQIPDALKNVVENNLFYGVTAFDGRLLKAEICSEDKENRVITHKIQMMDVYGDNIAEYVCSSDDAYHIPTITATDDGGFLFVLGFSDYAYDQDTWASDKGFASRVIKCDKAGNVQFDTPLDGIEGQALRCCFEKDGQFYFFGTIETPETKTRGIHSPTDVYMIILNENGVVLKTQCIAGSDYDSLDAAEITDDGFLLSVSSQSEDGDFADSNSNGFPVDWTITLSFDLEIIHKKTGKSRDYLDYRIGEKGENPVYKSDPLLSGFDAGTPQVYIDYGDFYLIVSQNNTGIYENTPPTISSIWYYTETVYSAYDNSGNIIFRASVDSSDDYDAWIESFYAKNSCAS